MDHTRFQRDHKYQAAVYTGQANLAIRHQQRGNKMFDIMKHITENNDTLNEANRAMSAIAIDNFVDKLRNADSHLHKAAHWAQKDLQDPSIDRNFKILIKKHLDLIKSTEEMAHAIYRARF